MRQGLVIGKFLPLHKGHIALINFAVSHCDEVIVSMSVTEHDLIAPALRLGWIKEVFNNNPSVTIQSIQDDFDQEDLLWKERIKIWAAFVKKRFPNVNIIVSSEEYGQLLAQELGITSLSFDPQRIQFPVSAFNIRGNPFKYWDFIPNEVRPYFVKKICFYGPESTGKSYMAKRMAAHFKTEWVPEVAREIVTTNDFTVDDIIKIGYAQTERILEKAKIANKILFCDTDLITTQIYCRHYLKVVPPILYQLEKQIKYDLYFLFEPDVPWVADGLRDLGDRERRIEMFEVFKMELDMRNIPYTLVKGSWGEREEIIKREVDQLLAKN